MFAVAVVGNVDAAKSTLIGVLTQDSLDDGNGSARRSVLTHIHEQESGRTSSITCREMIDPKTNRCLELIDLAGHERYLATTVRGLTSYFPSYALVLVEAGRGFTRTTVEHFSLCRSLHLPIIIVITKIDLVTVSQSKSMFATASIHAKEAGIRYCYDLHTSSGSSLNDLQNDKYETMMKQYLISPQQFCPIFRISNKTGHDLFLLRKFLFNLLNHHHEVIVPQHNAIDTFLGEWNLGKAFSIQRMYWVRGIGCVVSGNVLSGPIHKNDRLWIGPYSGKFVEVRVRSIHDDFRNEISTIEGKRAGCLAIKPIHSGIEFQRRHFRSGKIVLNRSVIFRQFRAHVYVLTHSTTVRVGYNPTMHCAHLNVPVRVVDMDRTPLIKGESGNVTFQFASPQFIYPGVQFILRDGLVKAMGTILEMSVDGFVPSFYPTRVNQILDANS